MAENAIASGAAILTADADGVVKGLNRAQNEITKFGTEAEASFEKTQGKLNKAFGKFAKKEGGFLGMLGGGVVQDFGLGGTAAIITGVVLGAEQVVKKFSDWALETKAIEKALEESKTRMEEIAKLAETNVKLADEWRATMFNPKDVAASFDTQIDELIAQRKKLEKDLSSPYKNVTAKETPYGLAPDKIFDRKATEEAVKSINVQIDGLQNRLNRLNSPKNDPGFVGEINKATNALDKQVEAWGLTHAAADRAIFKMRGANDEMLAGFDKVAAEIERLSKTQTPAWLTMILGTAGAGATLAQAQPSPVLTATFQLITDITGKLKAGPTFDEFLGINLPTEQNVKKVALAALQIAGLFTGGAAGSWQTKAADKLRDFAGAVESGSKEAYSLEMKNRFQNGQDVAATMAERQKQAVDEQKRTTRAIEKLENRIDKAFADVGVV